MKFEIITKRQMKIFIKSEISRQLADFYRDLNKIRNEVISFKEEIKCRRTNI